MDFPGNKDIYPKAIVDRMNAYRLRFLRVMTYFCPHDPELARDSVQEAYLRTLQAIKSGIEIKSLEFFMRRVAENYIRDQWKSIYYSHEALNLDEKEEEDADSKAFFDPALSIEERMVQNVIGNVRYECFLKCMRESGQKDQDIMQLRFVERLGLQEIAEIVGMNFRRVSERIRLFKARLIQALEEKKWDIELHPYP
jgi:RNA polymerase sigma factor (sigma-70 family)